MNQIPVSPCRHRLAIIGEGPSEEDRGVPFSGPSGRLLSNLLSQLNLPINRLFLGYVSTKRTYGWSQTVEDKSVIQATDQLRKDLSIFKPNCCLLLGDLANKVFGSTHNAHTQRGTIFLSPTFRLKCVTAQDPWMIQKNHSLSIPFRCDLNKAKDQSCFPEYRHPVRTINATPTFQYLANRFEQILSNKPSISFDLEGHPNQVGVTCYSIALSPQDCFIVPFRNKDNSPYWTINEEVQIWKWTAQVLSDPDIPKTAQNAMYELFVFAWRHKILIRGLDNDTMFQSWEMFSELPKSLAFISSLHTNEPYYKDERTVPDLTTHHEYCCKDSIVTLQSSEKMTNALVHPPSQKHYRFNIKLLKPYLYMQLRGCRLDLPAVAEMRQTTWQYIRQQQEVVNQMTSRVINTKSPKQLQDYLYNDLSLPVQNKKLNGKLTPTADFGALCVLYTKTDLPVLLEIGKLTRARTRLSDLNKLQAFPDGRIRCNYNPVGTDTGRLSSSETWVEAIVNKSKIEFKKRKKGGVEYQEMVLTTKPTAENLGTNLQNVTKDLRTLFIPDTEDHSFFQYDLSGADAWTVAADLAALGNDKMLVHLQNKIKPSIVIVLLTEFGNSVYEWDLSTLKQHHNHMLHQCKTVPKFARTYTCAKGCQHGCVTAGHEVLTRLGWIPIEQLRDGVEIMTWKNGISQWEIPSFLTRYDYTGTLHHFKGTAYDLSVTHDHRMPYHTNNSWKEANASQMIQMKSGKLPVSGDTFAGLILPTDFTKLLAAFQSDGCVNRRNMISFHFRKQRKVVRLLGILNDLGQEHKVYYQNDNTVIIEFKNEQLRTIGKTTSWQMLLLSSQSMKLYLEETLYWGGCVMKNTNVRYSISTAVLQRAEVMNTMAHLCGFGSQLLPNCRTSGFGSKMHEISLNERTKASRSSLSTSTEQVINKPVYCVTVSSSFFFVRRNNKIMVTGNSNYGMQPALMASLQLERSVQGWVDNCIAGTVEPPEFKVFHKNTIERLQNLYLNYYGIELRNDYLRRQLCNHGYLDAASGQRRYFLDIRNRSNIEDSIIRVAASHEPQANTTFSTNAALANLYYDKENRTPRGNLRAEPTLMIHDALAGQTHKSQQEWAKQKLESSWFDIPLLIHGLEINIPVEGGFGKNWKHTE